MGSFFTDLLSFDHEVAVYDIDPKRLRFMYNTQRFTSLDEIELTFKFAPVASVDPNPAAAKKKKRR